VDCIKKRYTDRIAFLQGGPTENRPGGIQGGDNLPQRPALPTAPSHTEGSNLGGGRAGDPAGMIQAPPPPSPTASDQVALAAANDSSAGGGCLSYSPALVTLTGTITPKTFPGKPNFESVEKGDEPETVWILTLSSPACVNEQKVEDHTLEGHADVRDLQLLIDDQQKYDTYRPLLGRTVSVTGTLDEAVSLHNHTPVMLSVRDLADAIQQEPTGTSQQKQVPPAPESSGLKTASGRDSSPRTNVEGGERASKYWTILVLVLVGLDWIYCLSQGLQNRIILYFDGLDVFLSILGPVLLFTSFGLFPVLSATGGDAGTSKAVVILLAVGGTACSLITFRLSIKHNRAIWVGCAVAVYKLSFSFLWFALLLGQLGRGADERKSSSERLRETFFGLLIALLLFKLMKRLVNGRAVYAMRNTSQKQGATSAAQVYSR
jgi:hypothetical protein